jgi:hypothetical protein
MNDFIAVKDPFKDIIALKITFLHSQYKTSSFHLRINTTTTTNKASTYQPIT